MHNFLFCEPIPDRVLLERLLLPKLRSNPSGPSCPSWIVSWSNASNLKPCVLFFPYSDKNETEMECGLENGNGNIPPDFSHVESAPGGDGDRRRTWRAE